METPMLLTPPPQEGTPRKFTVDEYEKLGELGILQPTERVELIDGLIVHMAPIGPDHQAITEFLVEEFVMQSKSRYRVGPGRPVPLPPLYEPEPDVVLSKRDIPRTRHPRPEEIFLVVEVAQTTLKRDQSQKRIAYCNASIPEYWIIDIATKEVRTYTLTSQKTYAEKVYSGRYRGTVATQAFPDVQIDLQNLFAS
jgi:Uma2 family endonuclease